LLPQSSGDTVRWSTVLVVKAKTNAITWLYDVEA